MQHLGAGETGSASSQVVASAKLLFGEGVKFKLTVEKFLKTVRAASYFFWSTFRKRRAPRLDPGVESGFASVSPASHETGQKLDFLA